MSAAPKLREAPSMQVKLLDLATLHAGIRQEMLAAIGAVFDTGAFVAGPFAAAFEKDFAQYLGAGFFAYGCANGTDAITLAAKALDLAPNTTAIVPAMTFFGTVEGLLNAGLRIALVDVSPDTGLIAPEAVKRLRLSGPVVLVPVHLYGQMADMRLLTALAKERGWTVLEDAAQAHGALRAGACPGELGDVATFSFYPGKNLGALGDAGAVVSKSAPVVERCRALGNHGGLKRYEHDTVGHNSRLDAFQAAVLRTKLPLLDRWNETRRQLARRYRTHLSGLDALTLPTEAPDSRHSYHLFVIRTKHRDALAAFLADRGVETGRHYPNAIHELPALRKHLPENASYPNAEAFAREGLSLPMCPTLTETHVDYVCEQILAFFRSR